MLSGRQKVRSLPAFRLEGFAAVAAFALRRLFLTAAEQWLGDDGFGFIGTVPGRLAHGHALLGCVEECESSGRFLSLSSGGFWLFRRQCQSLATHQQAQAAQAAPRRARRLA